MPSTAKKIEETGLLNVGDKAPDFSLPGDGDSTISLAGLKGKKVVLYFYPKDDTPGCTVEANDFSKRSKDFEKADTVIIGISKDTVKKHDGFKEKYCLTFTLASDFENDTCERYGVWVQKSMYGKTYMGINRATFLIDAQGKIAQIWPKVKIEGHADEVLKAAQGL